MYFDEFAEALEEISQNNTVPLFSFRNQLCLWLVWTAMGQEVTATPSLQKYARATTPKFTHGQPNSDSKESHQQIQLTYVWTQNWQWNVWKETHTHSHTRTENWWQDVAWSIKYMYGIYKTIIGMEVVDGQSLVSRWRLICIFLPKSHNCTTWGCTWQTLIPVCEHALNWMSSAKSLWDKMLYSLLWLKAVNIKCPLHI